ncbi:tyrosine-type recombinase/integrase [Paraburkholderia graminis]
MSNLASALDHLDEELAEWVIRRAKCPTEMPSPIKSLVSRILPDGFPIVVDERTGTICEPILLFLYDTFLKARSSGFVLNTALAYCFDIKQWLMYLEEFGLTWTEVTPFNLDSYFEILNMVSPQTGKTYAAETKNRRKTALESFYAWGRQKKLAATDTPENGLLKIAIAKKKRFKKSAEENRPVSVLQKKQASSLFKELGPEPAKWTTESPKSSRDWLACNIAISAGLRISEVRELKLSKFRNLWSGPINPLKRYPIKILGKGGVQRTAKFPGELLLDLKAYAQGERAHIVTETGGVDSDYLLLNPTSIPRFGGKVVSVRSLERAFSVACIRSGLYSLETIQDISWGPSGIVKRDQLKCVPLFVFHDLRHTFAVWTYYTLKANGIIEPWLDISACLGHKFLSTTLDIYLRGAPEFEASVSDDYEEYLNAI